MSEPLKRRAFFARLAGAVAATSIAPALIEASESVAPSPRPQLTVNPLKNPIRVLCDHKFAADSVDVLYGRCFSTSNSVVYEIFTDGTSTRIR